MDAEAKNAPQGEDESAESGFPDSARLARMLRDSLPKNAFLTTAQELLFSAGRNEEHRRTLLDAMVRLHEDGIVDILREIGRFLNDKETNPLPNFWGWMHWFRPLFSELPFPLESICSLFAAFDERWKRNMANGIWWDYLSDRFRSSPDSAEEMLRLAEQKDEFCPGVRRAFSAGLAKDTPHWLERAIGMMERPGTRTKRYFNEIVLALSDVDFGALDSGLAARFWERFAKVSDENDPCFDWFAAYMSLHVIRAKGFREEVCGTVLGRVLGLGDPAVLERMLIFLAADWKTTDEEERQWSLDALEDYDPQKPFPIDAFGSFASTLLREGFTKTAADVLSSYLVRRNAELSDIPYVVDECWNDQRPRIGEIATAWLLSGNRILEKAAGELLPFEIESGCVPSVDESQLNLGPQELLVFAAKVIGYLFDKPKTLFRFLFPCVNRMDEDTRRKIRPVIFDPVFLCYHDDAGECLASKDFSLGRDAVDFLRCILDEAKNEMAVLSKSGPFPELRSPMRQQIEIERIRERELEDRMESSRQNSILEVLTHKISLLHGNGWILYQPNEDGTLVRSPGELQRHSVSLVLPRLPYAIGWEFDWRRAELKMGNWNIDPVEELGE